MPSYNLLTVSCVSDNWHEHVSQIFQSLRSKCYKVPVALQTTHKNLWMLFVAVCAHKGFVTVSMATRFLRRGCSVKWLIVLLLPFHILPPLAIVLAVCLGAASPRASLVALALATGAFLYVGAFEVVKEEFSDHQPPNRAAGAVAGDCAAAVSSQNCLDAAIEAGITMEAVARDNEPESVEWSPSKLLKFAMFAFGSGLLLVITAVLPEP
jgi:ZIP Zinc transporter